MIEIIVLALASTVRPTSMAAVSALLTKESRRRLMLAYVACGLIFTVLFGLLVVTVFHGIHIEAGSSRTVAIADIIAGAAALLLGIAILTGALARAPRPQPRAGGGAWMARLDHEVTVRVAAVVGPLTHIPGILYLIALNLIVASSPHLPGDLLAVAVYNAIWFAVPIAALVVCIADPDKAQSLVADLAARAKRHSRTIVLATCFIFGAVLLVRGLKAI